MYLRDWIHQRHPLPAQLRVIESVTAALADAHSGGLLHKALRPENIPVTEEGECTLEFDQRPSSPAEAPSYLAPEVADGRVPTQKSDIFSAGVVFYEVLTGEHPFEAFAVPPTPLKDVRSDVSRDLTDAITACMEKDPGWRPADLSYLLEVVRKLRGEAGGASAKAAPKPKDARPATGGLPKKSGAAPGRWGSASGPPIVPIAAGVAGLLALGSGWYWLTRPTADNRSARTTTAAPATAPAQPQAAPAAAATAGPAATPKPTPPPAATPTPAAAAAATPIPPPTTRPASTPPPPPTTQAAAPPTLPPATQAAAPPPTLAPAAVVPELPAVPASLSAIAPFSLKRGATNVVDVHGKGLRSDHRPIVFKAKTREAAPGFTIVKTRLTSSELLLVFIQVAADAAPGKYTFALADAQGNTTNLLNLEVPK